jgi:hypothetical protein
MQSSNALYPAFNNARQGTYPDDGTTKVHTTIQAALDSCTANRNDYVIVMPDSADYDITAALTMSKARTHLICPAGLGWGGMTPNMVRIHQNTASTAYITVSADTVEIAGFFFKQDATSRDNIIVLSGTRWCPWIHDNFFGMSATASTSKYGIYGDGAVSHFVFEKNYFTNYNPGLMTGTDNDIAAFIGLTSASCTRGVVRDNLLHTGANTVVVAGIRLAGYGNFVIHNILWEDVAFGGSQAGTFTAGINISVDSIACDNRIGLVDETEDIQGGTADQSLICNYDGTSGGTLSVAD